MITRRTFLQQAGAAAAALYLFDPAALSFSLNSNDLDAGYWAFADHMQSVLEPAWNAPRAAYIPPGSRGSTAYNAHLLYTHATAALAGHTGDARRDDRARSMALRLCASPPWREPWSRAPSGATWRSARCSVQMPY